MDYKILKEKINAEIFENNQQQITGTKLNQVLTSMVDTLGKGYQFGGVVHPDTPFNAGDTNMAFFASEAGKYSAFGGFTLLGGEIGVFTWDGTWRKEIFYKADNIQVYGVRHYFDMASPDLTRIGDSALHRDLPIQSKMRRCVVNSTGDVLYYLHHDNSELKEDGTKADLSGADGMVMVEVMPHWRRITLNDAQKYMDVEVSEFPFKGALFIDRYLVSAYEASMDREANLLSSVVNKTAKYRGGDNDATIDGQSNTLLGMPVTNLSLTDFRKYAKARGTGWGCYDWNIHCDIFWLFAIEYATLNSQKAFNPNLDSVGFHQGGLGDGVTQFNQWQEYNGSRPFIPCGTTNSLGNKTGVVKVTISPTDIPTYTAGEQIASVPSYRGIETLFGHILKWTDGFLAIGDGTTQTYFISRDREQYADSINGSYEEIGKGAGANGYVRSLLCSKPTLSPNYRNYGDLLANSVEGADRNTYFCDYHYEDKVLGTTYGVYVGGHAGLWSQGGFACNNSATSPAFVSAAIGSRLSWKTPKTV